MEQYVIQQQIREKIAGRKVTAALFYTFNFDPVFFENYVMPLLVPEKSFRDEMIYNKILWRQCLKEGIIPPITVYCDFFAKDHTTAPALGYHIHSLRIPAAPNHICNYHPKHIFLLLEKDNVQSLLLITGSGNITIGGWCENMEAFSIEELQKNNTRPRTVNRNGLQQLIMDNAALKGTPAELSEAEEKIENILRYIDFDNKNHFSSLRQSFKTFLEEQIFLKDTIREAEIISPYFSEDTALLHYLKEKQKIEQVRCLIPASRHNEIQISEQTFTTLQKNGLIWSEWNNYRQDNQSHNRNAETRNLHAKIYRFKGNQHTYTIIGSVNFTKPAWKHYSPGSNQANIEAAWLYIENRGADLLSPKSIDTEHYYFIDKENQDQAGSLCTDRNIPELDFVLNWKNRTLNLTVRKQAKDWVFHNILRDTPIKKNQQYNLSPEDIRRLSRNTLVEIRPAGSDDTSRIVSYYVQQENISSKPLDFKLSAAQILKYWEFIDDIDSMDALISNVAERITDESGIVDEKKLLQQTQLNEMASHFNGLIRLEKYIFNQAPQELLRKLEYYLLSESIDTLSYYLSSMDEQFKENKITKSFYWMILQIISIHFYNRALHKLKASPDEKHKNLKTELRSKKTTLEKEAEKLSSGIAMTEQQKLWMLRQLRENHA